MTRIVITGSRDWIDQEYVREVVDTFPPRSLVIVGGARGADQIVEAAARIRGHKIHVEKAKWDEEGKGAGVLRNIRMLDMAPDLVVAFWIGRSKGTGHTITQTMNRGIPLQLHWRKNP